MSNQRVPEFRAMPRQRRRLPTRGRSSRAPDRGTTQAVYYRDDKGREPVNDWIEKLLTTAPAAAAKIDDHVEEYLNGRRCDDPPPEFPITSQIEGGLRELRIRFGNNRYRLLYQRSDNLVILLHGLEKNTGEIPTAAIETAQKLFADFRARMNAEPRVPPRAAGHDAPAKRDIER